MISIEDLNSFEKNAAKIGESIFKGVGKAFKLMGENPKTTLGLIAGAAGASYLADKAMSWADRAHPLHQMVREEVKSKDMKEQRDILRAILDAQTKKTENPIAQELIQTKLSSYKDVPKSVAEHFKRNRGKYGIGTGVGSGLVISEALRQRNRNRNIITGSLDKSDE